MVCWGVSSWDAKNTLLVATTLPTHSLCVRNHIRVGRVTVELLHRCFSGEGMCVCASTRVCVCVCVQIGRERVERKSDF